ncbi:DUF5011 domain-containing protein [Ectothiorhodospiraceae bacterium BW-2]|nr:DUF5011 domain-containing protein [Ectothiorhodospiraceae bacterium BW-2]
MRLVRAGQYFGNLDSDEDGVSDAEDNCRTVSNSNQANRDGDSAGDACDAFPDDPNEWLDSDGDGVGNNADAFDNDPNETSDRDSDGVGDNSDNCPEIANPEQEILACNDLPSVSAGSDRQVDEGTTVTLSGTASDPDGTIVSIAWSQTAGSPTVTINSANTLNASFSAPSVATPTQLTFTLSVTDNSGSTNSDSVIMTINDTTAPTITLDSPQDGQSYDRLPTIIVTASDESGDSVTVEVQITDVTDTTPYYWGLAFGAYDWIVTETWLPLAYDESLQQWGLSGSSVTLIDTHAYTLTARATDSVGNVSTTTANITVTDLIKPVINLNGNSSLTLNIGQSYTEQGATASDNVDGDISNRITLSGSVDTSRVGLYTLSYNVSDAAGNAAQTVTRSITVQDGSAPVVTPPANITVAASNATGTPATHSAITSFLNSATASDNIDGDLTQISHNAPNQLPLGVTVVTFSATDSQGNRGSAQATITVTDQTKPILTLNGNSALTLNIGQSYTEQGATASDNVDGDISNRITLSGSVDTSRVGLYTLNYNVSDAAGNAAQTVTRSITVQDGSAPVVTPPANITVAAIDATGTPATHSAITSFLNSATASDAVDGLLTSIGHNAPTTFPLGATVVTFSATDSSNNTGRAQAIVTVADQSRPVITLTGSSALTLNIGQSYTEQGATASDNVDGDISNRITLSGSVDTSRVGLYTLSYNVSDAAGNAAQTVTRSITVQDGSAPVVTPPANITVAASNATGTPATHSAITSFLNSATASDNIDGDLTQISHNAPNQLPLGVTVVTFSATDSQGNRGSAQATITVTDQTKPILTLNGNSALTLNIGQSYTEQGATASDNVDGDISNRITLSGSVDTSRVGLYTLSYNVSDAAGNAAQTVTRSITVQDGSAPVVTPPANITVAASNATGTPATHSAITSFLNSATASDNIDGDLTQISHNAPNQLPLGVTVVTFSATDSQGNRGSAQATITVTDQTNPILTLNGNSALTLNIGQSYTEQGATASDNVDGDISNRITLSGSVDTSRVGLYTLNYNVSDAAGNAAQTVTRSITVQDGSAPVVTPPANITVAAIDATGTPATHSAITSFLNSATASDAVDGLLTSIGHNAPTTFPLGATVVTFSATDSSNNTGRAQAIVTVADQSRPVITLTGSSALTLNIGQSYTEQGATASDNVDGDISNRITLSGSVDTSRVGLYTLSYNVSDAAGNAAQTVTRSITVQDGSAPVVTPPANITVAASNATGTPATHSAITSFLNSATASDNIDGDLTQISHNAPNQLPLGVTVVTFSATDSQGNRGSAQATITVTDQTKPILTLNGNSALTLNIGQSYTEQGATASDNVDGDISNRITLSGSVDTSRVGLYTLNYNVSDAAGNAAQTVTRSITVQDGSAPVVTPPANITVAAIDATGTPATHSAITSFLNSATASDNIDGDLTQISHNAPNQLPLGSTTVTFSATDSQGNTGSAQAVIIIADLTPPTLTLNGETDLTHPYGESYTDPGASANDTIDGDLTDLITLIGSVNSAALGSYTLTYTVEDRAGNANSTTRHIHVIDTLPPTINPPEPLQLTLINQTELSATDNRISTFLSSATADDNHDGTLSVSHNAPATFASGTTPLTFNASDSSGNTAEATTTLTLTTVTDHQPPATALISPTDGQTAALLPAITVTASDAESRVTEVAVQISDITTPNTLYWGASEFGGYDWQTSPAWLPLTYSATSQSWGISGSSVTLVDGNTYTITSRATDEGNNQSYDSILFAKSANQAHTELTLTASASTILQNGTLSISGKLTRLPVTDASMAGRPITLTVTTPELAQHHYDLDTYDTLGHFSLDSTTLQRTPDGSADLFSIAGRYRIEANSTATPLLAASRATTEIVVGQGAGYALIVQGKIGNEEGLQSHNKTTNRVYATLIERGFEAENIHYLNYDPQQTDERGQPFIDGLPSKAAIQQALNSLADAMNSAPAPLLLVMVDHGDPNLFYLGNETLTATELNDYLSQLEQQLTTTAIKHPRTLIYGACYSGSFIDEMSQAPQYDNHQLTNGGRLIITSSAGNELSHKGPMENDGIRVGELFIEHLFTALQRGESYRDAFDSATAQTERTTTDNRLNRSGTDIWFDRSVQHPLFDDNGDSYGTNDFSLACNEGELAAQLYLGVGANYDTNSADNPAELTAIAPTQHLHDETPSLTLWSQANHDNEVLAAWIELKTPATSLDTRASTEQVTLDLPRHPMIYHSDNGRWEVTLTPDHFNEAGLYELYYYVNDIDGRLAPPWRGLVYRQLAANLPPEAPQLTYPTNDSTQKSQLIARWSETNDPEDHPLSYTLRLSQTEQTDSSGRLLNPQYTLEELTETFVAIDDNYPLDDLTTYYWQISAIDYYGAVNHSPVQNFRVDNTNGSDAIIDGIVFSYDRSSPLANITISANGIETQTSDRGRFMLQVTPQAGTTEAIETTLTLAAAGYATLNEPTRLQPGRTQRLFLNLPTLEEAAAGSATNACVTPTSSATDNNTATSTDTDSDSSTDSATSTETATETATDTGSSTSTDTATDTANDTNTDTNTDTANDTNTPNSQTLNLTAGWNLIALHTTPDDSTTVADHFTDSAIERLFAFINNGWQFYDRSSNNGSLGQLPLSQLRNRGIWVKVAAGSSANLTLTGSSQSLDISSLTSGWNLIGSGSSDITVTDFVAQFSSQALQPQRLFAFINNSWSFADVAGSSGSLNTITAGQGVWVYLQ